MGDASSSIGAYMSKTHVPFLLVQKWGVVSLNEITLFRMQGLAGDELRSLILMLILIGVNLFDACPMLKMQRKNQRQVVRLMFVHPRVPNRTFPHLNVVLLIK